MAEPNATPTPEGLEKLLSNPDLIRTVGALMGGTPTASDAENPAADGLSRVLSDPELLSKLPQVMEMLKPALQGVAQESTPEAESLPVSALPSVKPPHSHRDDLLLALKPFLSPERAQKVDMLLRLERLGSVLQVLK
ncbi:MAG: hypothetical protein IJW29_01475 [Clostridia bacterium]|nr:hypothetical protein [Clostridia bacterium]